MGKDRQFSSRGSGTFKAILLFLLVVLLVGFGILKIQVNGDPSSAFNQTTRFSLGKYELLRSLLGLHDYGDARYSYLSGQTPISLQYAQADGLEIDDYIIRQFAEKIQNVTGRKVAIFPSSSFKAGKLTDADLEEIVSRLKRNDISGQPTLFVMFTEDFEREEGEVGKTFKEFGIVLSFTKLKEVTQAKTISLPEYVLSSLLHEFGHQIGLEHNLEKDCIMNQTVESPELFPNELGEYTTTNFCEVETERIKEIKSKQ